MWSLRDGHWERQIDVLDPVKDCHAITMILAGHVFPIETFIASELGQLRTFAIPSIARLLKKTGRYEREPQRRVDDTKGIVAGIVLPGPDSVAGDNTIHRLNHIHGHYKISNEDFLYTLCALTVSPWELITRYGWRRLRPVEEQAVHVLWSRIAAKMGIQGVPERPEQLRAWRDDYDRRALGRSEEAVQITARVLTVAHRFVPAPFHGAIPEVVSALMGAPAVSEALGLPLPRPSLLRALDTWMWGRARLLRRVDPWRHRSFWTSRLFLEMPSYPQGYSELGPPELFARRSRAEGSGPVVA